MKVPLYISCLSTINNIQVLCITLVPEAKFMNIDCADKPFVCTMNNGADKPFVCTMNNGADKPFVCTMNNGPDKPFVCTMNNGADKPFVCTINNGADKPFVCTMNNGTDKPFVCTMNNGADKPFVCTMNNGADINTRNSYRNLLYLRYMTGVIVPLPGTIAFASVTFSFIRSLNTLWFHLYLTWL